MPNDFFNLLSKEEDIEILSSVFPTLKFGQGMLSISGVEITQEANGYTIRLQAFATFVDYKLFVMTISLLIKMTDGNAFPIGVTGEAEESPIEDPFDKYDDDWIERERGKSFYEIRSLMKFTGKPVIIDGLFGRICLGVRMFNSFDILIDGPYDREKVDNLQEYLSSIQGALEYWKGTKSDFYKFQTTDNNNPPLSVSQISVKDGKVNDFDYISEADLLKLVDFDDNVPREVIIPFEETWKILPEDSFRLIDDLQFERIKELTVKDVHEMMNMACRFQINNPPFTPTFPGEGYDKTQNTFILTWNPSISSYSLNTHKQSIKNLLSECFNWSVWEYEKAKMGDRFYMVKVGEGKTGIVMSGIFSSHPYEAKDWNGKDRHTFYMDLLPNLILDPDNAPLIDTEELNASIPTFEWHKGHSGRILTELEAQTIEEMWKRHIKSYQNLIDGEIINAIRIKKD